MHKVEIAFCKGYRVDRNGTARGINVKILAAPPNDQGYRYFRITIGGKSKCITVHRLQAYQKFGQDMFHEGTQVRHLNGNKLDNSWGNIAIGTASDNMRDIPANLRHTRSVQGGRTRSHLTVEDVQEIRRLHSDRGWKYAEIMVEFGIAKSTVAHIIRRETWCDI